VNWIRFLPQGEGVGQSEATNQATVEIVHFVMFFPINFRMLALVMFTSKCLYVENCVCLMIT